MKKAIVILSGGLDSTTCLAIAKSKGYKINALTFDYGQRNKFEIKAAKKITKYFNCKNHLILKIDLNKIGGSALTDFELKVPDYKRKNKTDVPITYVPARNLIFLSYACSYGEVINAYDIFIGVNIIDYSGYPDCRKEFIKSFEKTINLATDIKNRKNKKFKIHTPLIKKTKVQIIRTGLKLGVDYKLTFSCYNPDKQGKPCLKCDACNHRIIAFEKLKMKDPVLCKN